MARKTSAEAYRTIEENGLLSKRRFEVYDCLYYHGPMTASETFRRISGGRPNYNFDSNTRARFTELRDQGVIAEIGEKKCAVTGMTVILWDVTSELPTPLPKKVTSTEKIKILSRLVAEIVFMMDKKYSSGPISPIMQKWMKRAREALELVK
jgi:hypothetical protein